MHHYVKHFPGCLLLANNMSLKSSRLPTLHMQWHHIAILKCGLSKNTRYPSLFILQSRNLHENEILMFTCTATTIQPTRGRKWRIFKQGSCHVTWIMKLLISAEFSEWALISYIRIIISNAELLNYNLNTSVCKHLLNDCESCEKCLEACGLWLNHEKGRLYCHCYIWQN